MTENRRVIITAQDKGGDGKTHLTRALAETVPAAAIFELEVGPRLLELKDRVKHFEARASLSDIQATGGRAAKSEFYPILDAIADINGPGLVDVGANTSTNFFGVIANNAMALDEAGIELGVIIVASSDPSAVANARAHAVATASFARARFLVQNRIERGAPLTNPLQLGDDFIVTMLEDAGLRDEGKKILDAIGLKGIANLDAAALRKKYGFAVGGELHLELTRVRYEAMKAVEPAARWLAGEANV